MAEREGSAPARIIVGVSGGIAAYKAIPVVRGLRARGHGVRVIPTAAALEFVGAATWEALTGLPATRSVFDNVPAVEHVRLGQEADLVVIVPATADVIARLAAGMANDLLAATVLATSAPVLVAPAMHTEMWLNPATVENVATLRRRGVDVLEPATGPLTGPDEGIGRLPEPEQILDWVVGALDRVRHPMDLQGLAVVISAGGTREPLDPVRYLGNRSSGKQGVALARTARARGADVTLIAANLEVPAPSGVRVITVGTALELADAVGGAVADADVLVMAAAVADFRPEAPSDVKIKKLDTSDDVTVSLVRNPDILAGVAHARPHEHFTVVGFAAETGSAAESVTELGRRKAIAKGADLLAVNEVGEGKGFGTDENSVTILDHAGERVADVTGSKDDVAHTLWDAVVRLRQR